MGCDIHRADPRPRLPNILALDLSIASTGWARHTAGDGQIESGVVSFELLEGEHPGKRWPRVREWLATMASGMDWIVWEGVVSGNFQKQHHTTIALLHNLECQVVEMAATLGQKIIETATVPPSTLKKHATGDGHAKKPEMIAAALSRWPHRQLTHVGRPLGDNEADALCVLAWGLDVLLPSLASET